MAETGPGLDYVLDRGLEEWRLQPSERRSVYGAAGRVGEALDREMIDLFESRLAEPPPIQAFMSADPYTRMFSTSVGQRAVRAVGNETRTLAALGRLSVEVMAEALQSVDAVEDEDRLLAIPAQGTQRPPVLVWMSPRVASVRESRNVSAGLDLPFRQLLAHLDVADLDDGTPEALALREVLGGGVQALVEMFVITRPEVVLTRKPRMIPLCVPSPHLEVQTGAKLSTVGIVCSDASGVVGVTACFHGTGYGGTPVTVNGQRSHVKHVSEVQDLVFIPGIFTPAGGLAGLIGRGGILGDREPAKSDRVHFDGATNQRRETRIYSTDAGLLRARPNIMLKVQTGAETDEGDSGCALRDRDDRVLGFAFERTSYDDDPQFTDWIWAANALRALQLSPLTGIS